jgi:DHA2 family lincomycin resistance protein-like MFS transporter
MAGGAGLAFGIGAGVMAVTIALATMIKRPEGDGERTTPAPARPRR